MSWRDVVSRLWIRFKAAYWVDFDPDASDGFFGVDYLMVLGGLHLESGNAKVRRWWNIYRAIIVPMPVALFSWKLALNASAGKKMDVVLQNGQNVLGAVVLLMRTVLVAGNYGRIMAVRRYVNERYFGRMVETARRTRAAGFCNVRWVVVTFCLFECCAICPLPFMDLTRNDSFGLPFDLREFSQLLNTCLEKFFCVMLTGLTANFVVNSVTVYMILKGLLTELTVVAATFEGIMDRTEISTSAKFDLTAGASRHLHRTRQRFFWKYLQDEFRHCIRLHQEILNILATVKPFLNATFLILYYSTTLNIAFGTIFLLSTDPSQITIYSCQVLYFVGAVMLECCILTHLVTSLAKTNEFIADAIFDLPWPQQLPYEPEFAVHYRSTRNAMLAVMTKARTELRLNCFGFLPEFTLERFTELVNLAYSLVSFFRNFV